MCGVCCRVSRPKNRQLPVPRVSRPLAGSINAECLGRPPLRVSLSGSCLFITETSSGMFFPNSHEIHLVQVPASGLCQCCGKVPVCNFVFLLNFFQRRARLWLAAIQESLYEKVKYRHIGTSHPFSQSEPLKSEDHFEPFL